MKKKQQISKDQILKMERAISRELEISNGMRQCHHKVHKSAKTYTRKSKHKIEY